MGGDEHLQYKIVTFLSKAFVFRRTIKPEEVAQELAKSVDMPVDLLAEKVASVAKRLGIGVARP